MTHSPFISYAQNQEDVMLWRALRDESPGFYIDVGASDPGTLSVTRAFYERGWRGLDVEPLPELAALLRQARPGNVVVEAALSDAPGRGPFHRVHRNAQLGLSTLDPVIAAQSGGVVETLEVELTTLAALCREHVRGDVHFLKVDVEGAEAAVLRGADFAAVRPWIVVIEAVQPITGAPAGAECGAILSAAGYLPVWFDGLNRFYVAQERHAALARHFLAPPNPFDDFITADRAKANEQLAELGRLQGELARLQQQPAEQPAQRSWPQLVAWSGYRLVRPVLRPLLWRLRTFLVGPVRDEVAELRRAQDAIRSRLDQLAAERSGPQLDASMRRALEAVLLTVALERERKP